MSYYDKYNKYKKKYNKLKHNLSRSDTQNILYHGSPTKFDVLIPHPRSIVDNEEVVFATNTKWLSIVFIAKATDADIEIGFINNKPYILEQYPGAFDKFLVGKHGYIYHVDPKGFEKDKRLGMYNHEFISHDKTNILSTEEINDIYEALKKTEVNIIDFDTKAKLIESVLK